MQAPSAPRVAFITDAIHPVLTPDDAVAARALRALGWDVEPWIWGRPAPAGTSLALLRSPWDYADRVPEFLAWLAEIERTGPPILNSPALVRWNLSKAYLLDFQSAGRPVVPTARLACVTPEAVAAVARERGWRDRLVIKPEVSAGARDTYQVASGDGVIRRPGEKPGSASRPTRFDDVNWVSLNRRGATLVQPFLERLAAEGELSLIYFREGPDAPPALSHAVRKRAAAGDFRVQEEFGGTITPEPAPPATARAVADSLWEALPPGADGLPADWLYARVDLVPAHRGEGWWLGELELFEPQLFFRTAPARATELLGRALAARLGRLPSHGGGVKIPTLG